MTDITLIGIYMVGVLLAVIISNVAIHLLGGGKEDREVAMVGIWMISALWMFTIPLFIVWGIIMIPVYVGTKVVNYILK